MTGPADRVDQTPAVRLRPRQSMTTRVRGRILNAPRAVSSGSSMITVSAPTTDASIQAQPLHPAVGLGSREFSALAHPTDKAVRGRHGLEDRPWPAFFNPGWEWAVLTRGFVLSNTGLHLDAVLEEPRMAAAIDLRIWIGHRGNDSPDAGGGDSLDARPGSANMAAGFERAIQRGATRIVAGHIEGNNLRVRPPAFAPCPTTTPPGRTTTAPTRGLGVVVPRPRSARSNARAIQSASVRSATRAYLDSVNIAST